MFKSREKNSVLDKVDGKIKLVKQDKTIICNRPFEIKSIVCDESGSLLCSIGTNDDTEIQIFDPISSELKFKESTSAIQNLQMLMGPNDKKIFLNSNAHRRFPLKQGRFFMP